jgi:hypothetical protein
MDGLHVLDVGNLRWTVLDSQFAPLASVPLPQSPFSAFVIGDSLLVANMNVPTRQLAAIPIHIMGLDGKFRRSFGEVPVGYRSDYELAVLRHLAPSRAGTFWSAHVTRYQLDRWALNGVLLQKLTRLTDWFQPHFRGMEASPTQPPAPWMADVSEDSTGILWVLVLVADATWHKAVVRDSDGSYRWTSDRNGFLDSVIDAIDPETGTVLASHRSDVAYSRFVDRGHLAAYRESRPGVPFVDIWEFQLLRNERRPS